MRGKILLALWQMVGSEFVKMELEINQDSAVSQFITWANPWRQGLDHVLKCPPDGVKLTDVQVDRQFEYRM
jgi:hypothetical protein